MLGVNESTVKRWIDRGLLSAVRTPGGHRRVRREDLQAFLASQEGSRKHSYKLQQFKKHTETFGWSRYYELHRDYAPGEARKYLTGAFVANGSILTTLEQVVLPTLARIGAAWREGVLDIADEHRMTFLMRADLITLEAMLPAPPAAAPCALLACVPGENHELVLQMLSLVLRSVGWESVVLGINVPAREIERVVASRRIGAVYLAKLYPAESHLTYVRSVRRSMPHAIPLRVGGAGWNHAELTAIERMKDVAYVPSFRALAS